MVASITLAEMSVLSFVAKGTQLAGGSGCCHYLIFLILEWSILFYFQVNSYGNVVYDEYVRPVERIVDFRTSISGIRPKHMKKGWHFICSILAFYGINVFLCLWEWDALLHLFSCKFIYLCKAFLEEGHF